MDVSVSAMMGDEDAIGGSGASGADESSPGADGHSHETACLNCGAALIGPNCHRCGQVAHVHRTFMALLHDLAHGVFHFEGRIWDTLPMLAWRPGELTRRYIHGERVKFVSPFALFLFSVFLMFAVFSTIGGPLRGSGAPPAAISDGKTVTSIDEARRQLNQRIAEMRRAISSLEAAKTAATTARRSTSEIDARLARARSELDATLTIQRGMAGNAGKLMTGDFNLDTGIAWLDDSVAHINENPDLAFYKLQSSAYKFSWALIPISLPFIWLMFAWRPRFGLYDHAIFAIHSLSAMTLLVVALSLARAAFVPGALIGWALVLLPPLHMYRQLRDAYELSRFSAIWRTAFLLLSAGCAALGFFLLLLAMSLAG